MSIVDPTPALRYLGLQSGMPDNPDTFDIECVPNPESVHYYCARFTAPEFTSLCPVTGQPDFATIIIDYVPIKLLVESKALKLFLTSFRNVGDFHEAVTNKICNRLHAACEPEWMRVAAYFYPRGGIPIDVFCERGSRPRDIYVPQLEHRPYRGR